MQTPQEPRKRCDGEGYFHDKRPCRTSHWNPLRSGDSRGLTCFFGSTSSRWRLTALGRNAREAEPCTRRSGLTRVARETSPPPSLLGSLTTLTKVFTLPNGGHANGKQAVSKTVTSVMSRSEGSSPSPSANGAQTVPLRGEGVSPSNKLRFMEGMRMVSRPVATGLRR